MHFANSVNRIQLFWVIVGKLVTWTTRYSEGCPVLEELCSFLCFYEVKSTNLKMNKNCWDGVKGDTGWEWGACPPGVCDESCVCVCAQGGLVDNIEQGVQEAQDYVERAKDFIPKCKKFKKTGKRVRRNANTISAQLTLSCFSPFSSSSSRPLLPITHPRHFPSTLLNLCSLLPLLLQPSTPSSGFPSFPCSLSACLPHLLCN